MPKIQRFKVSFFTAFVLCFLMHKAFAISPEILVKKIASTQANQLEISLSSKTDFKVFTLENPNRLVIDLANSTLEADSKSTLPHFASAIRNKKTEDNLRIVLDLKQKINIERVRFEKVQKQTFGKLVVDIADVSTNKNDTSQAFIINKVGEFDVETKKVSNEDGSNKYVIKKTPKKTPIIVIDAGHGGKDPGTIGSFARSKEKNITLSYAKELAKQLNNTKRYKAFLTRDNDIFIPLKQRVAKARKMKADLFISIHANAISDKSVSGFSIYTLSEKSSDKQAELLAQKENRADIIAGVNFSGASEDIMKTLIDLSQRESKNSSARFANTAIKSIKKSEIEILQNTHRFAGFAVLTAPDMSSVLIELGYLSNKEEEKQLNSITYKRRITASLVKAIDEYFLKNE